MRFTLKQILLIVIVLSIISTSHGILIGNGANDELLRRVFLSACLGVFMIHFAELGATQIASRVLYDSVQDNWSGYRDVSLLLGLFTSNLAKKMTIFCSHDSESTTVMKVNVA